MTASSTLSPALHTDTPVTHVLYLHGFRSSPQSTKAVQVAKRMDGQHPAVHFWCPQLPPSPREAMALVLGGVRDWPADGMAVIGSSLGGFYADAVAAATGCRSVLLNPAVEPARDLARYIGEQTAWHDPNERFFFRAEFVQELRDLASQPVRTPQRCLALIAKGDEVLDWREMNARCAGAQIVLLEGGNHALTDFDQHIARVFAFLGLD